MRWVLFVMLGLLCGTLVYARWVEAYWLKVYPTTVVIPGLPRGFDGLRVVQLTDLHRGPYASASYLARALDMANALHPDLIVLTGDYVHRSPQYIASVYQLMSRLRAPLGVYAVLGNHDHWEDPDLTETQLAMAAAGVENLDNRNVVLTRGGQHLWLGGVADLWSARPDLAAATQGMPPNGKMILLSHNPDFVDHMEDSRVVLVLSGHTHGGQINLPLVGPPVLPSRRLFAAGLVQYRGLQVYISRGVGMITPPLRFRCRPEVTLLTLHAAP